MDKISLLADIAIGENVNVNLDGLGFSTYAKVIAQSAIGTSGPFTIGIFGEWGTGKTSLMRMIQDELSHEADIVTVWFNAWQYEKEEHPIVPLTATIIKALENNQTKLTKLKDGGKSIANSLRAVAYGFSTKSTLKMPGIAEMETSFSPKDAIDRAEKISSDPLLSKSLYENAFERIASLGLDKKIKIVVIIDDLDRCFPDSAIKLLETIKLLLSQPGFIFLIGVARSVIEGYLEHRYKKDFGLADFQGKFYLDKIVQLPFYIPPHHARMEGFMHTILERLRESDREKFRPILPIIISASGGNPRSTIRYVNNLIIDKSINEALAGENLMELIPIEYFAVTRSLQQRWLELFYTLVDSEEMCSTVATWEKNGLIQQISSDNQQIVKLAQTLLTDRDLQNLLFSQIGKRWLSNSTLRGSTVQFLSTRRVEAELSTGGKTYDVTFFYSLQDREFVSKIAEILVENDLQVLLTADVFAGENIRDKINLLVSNSRAVAYCLSDNYFKSLESELLGDSLKLSTLSGTQLIIPILLPGLKANAIPDILKNYQSVDLRNTKETDDKSLAFLINSLSSTKRSFLGKGRSIRILNEE